MLKDSNLADSLELLGLAVEEGRLGEAVEEGEEGKEVLARMEASYTSSLRQVNPHPTSTLTLHPELTPQIHTHPSPLALTPHP